MRVKTHQERRDRNAIKSKTVYFRVMFMAVFFPLYSFFVHAKGNLLLQKKAEAELPEIFSLGVFPHYFFATIIYY